MQKRNSGSVITKIKTKKETTDIYLFENKITIPNETYYCKNYKVGDYLSNSEIVEISTILEVNKLLNISMNLLKKHHYSEKEMITKLSKKTNDNKTIDKVINILKSYDLITVEMLMLDYIELANNKAYGKNKIINNLIKMGISNKLIQNSLFLKEIEKEKALNVANKLVIKYDNYSYKNKIKHIENNLLNKGFDYEIVRYALKNIDIINEDKDLIKNVYKKEKILLEKAYSEELLKKKLINRLKNKGFEIEDILEVIDYD